MEEDNADLSIRMGNMRAAQSLVYTYSRLAGISWTDQTDNLSKGQNWNWYLYKILSKCRPTEVPFGIILQKFVS